MANRLQRQAYEAIVLSKKAASGIDGTATITATTVFDEIPGMSLGGFAQLSIFTYVTAAATDAADTLTLVVDTHIYGGIWCPIVSFAAVAGNAAEPVSNLAKLRGGATENFATWHDALGAASVLHQWGDAFRLTATVVDTTNPGDASFTFWCVMIPN